MVAGEPSGDMLAARLLRALEQRVGKVECEGIAGPLMEQAGCRSVYPLERLSVNGLFESFGRYPELIPVRRRLAKNYAGQRPDVFIGVDAPDFNIDLELSLRQAKVPTVHYVSPSVWAWRRYRLPKIARAVDLMLTLFPFEQKFYEAHRVNARFVGHPLADEIPMDSDRVQARRELGLDEDRPLVALLPGSRQSEVKRLAEPMLRAARIIARELNGAQFILPAATQAMVQPLRDAAAQYAGGTSVHITAGQAHTAMAASDCIILASGTATLEAMLIKRPMVITYKTTALTWAIGRRMLHVPFVGLPNLLAEEQLVPELLQEAATPDRLAGEALRQLRAPQSERVALARRFAEIHATLRRDATAQAADAIIELLARIGHSKSALSPRREQGQLLK